MPTPVASPDISILDFSVLLDLSLASPSIKVTNLSTVINPNNLDWFFEVTSPSGVPIHWLDMDKPDINNAPFTEYVVPDTIPTPFGQVEFSNNNGYTVKVYVKDNAGTIFSQSITKNVCKPNGNNGKNNFGAAIINIETKCDKGKLFISDKTNVIYKGLEGNKISTTVDIYYPKDDSGNALAPIALTNLPAFAPIKYEGDGYSIYAVHIYQYDLGSNFYVKIRYSFKSVFPVWCNVDLCPLFCEYDKLLEIVDKTCDVSSKKEQNAKINLINGKLLKAVVGKMQPLCGFDVPKLVEEIKEIGGFTCDCCRPQGVFDTSVIEFSDATLDTNKVCGDMSMSFDVDDAGNIILNYKNFTYTFTMCGAKPDGKTNSAAFEFSQTQSGCNKNICLFVDKAVLANEILLEIQSNLTLINILTNIINNNGGIAQSSSCPGINTHGLVKPIGGACDYAVTISTTGLTKPSITGIFINSTEYTTTPIASNNASAVQTWLNGLGLGVFTVIYDSANNILTISTNGNTYNPVSIVYTQNATEKEAKFASSCWSICALLQGIFDYLSTLNLTGIKVGKDISVCMYEGENNVGEVEITEETTGANALEIVSSAICKLANQMANGKFGSNVIKNSFKTFNGQYIESDDIMLVIVDGIEQQIPVKNFAIQLFQLLCSDADVKAAFCQCGTCDSINNCNPVTNLTSSVNDTSAMFNWNTVVGAIGYKYSLDGINWTQINGTTIVISSLSPNTAYTFRVYPVYNNGDGVSCMVSQSFVTTNVGVSCIAPTNLHAEEVGTTQSEIHWNAVTGASGYQYQLNGGTWINVGNTLSNLLTGLTPNTAYNVSLRAIIGGSPCVQTSSTSFTTLEEGILLVENMPTSGSVKLDALTGIVYTPLIGALPLVAGESLTGTLGNYSGAIGVEIGNAVADVSLYKNGILQQTLPAIIGTYSFNPIVITTTDNIYILIEKAGSSSSDSYV